MAHDERYGPQWVASPTSTRSSTTLSDASEKRTSTPASSAHPLQGKIPVEVLIHILSHLSFPELYGTAQYVSSTWQHIVTRMILGNAVFLRRIIDTDYRKLFQGEIDTVEDTGLSTRVRLTDDTWQGIALDTRDLAKFPGLGDIRWSGKSSRKVFLIIREVYASRESAYALHTEMLTFDEQDDLDDENYEKLVKLSLDQRRPVLLDILDFCPQTGDLYIDLSDCYRALYFEYQSCLRTIRSLVDLLEANLWSTWCRKNAKYWGKKRAGMHVEGLLIDVVEQLTQDLEESYGDLELVFDKFDLYRRKLQTFELMSLQSLTSNKISSFDSAHRAMTPSWADHDPKVIVSSPDGVDQLVYIAHRANFDATLLLMVELFQWRSPGGMAEKVVPPQEYKQMFESWYAGMLADWKQTRIVTETTYLDSES